MIAEYEDAEPDVALESPRQYGLTQNHKHLKEMKAITGRWQRRYWEYLVMKDPEVHKAFKDSGVELISYRDLVNIRKRKKS